jgi:alkanesulfonate monooxygenase SsuD/methylene tetrahydromethanopterin reductase-like flavin-dependent oxidoreductase (luciferase family)
VTVRIGLGIITGQVPPGGTVTVEEEYRGIPGLAVEAERLGFDSVWLSEHHFAADGYLPSPTVVLGALAVATDRIRLGTAVLAPLYHPLRLAEDAAVIDQLSGGRLTLGLANGWRPAEFTGFGIPISERAVRLEETVGVLRQAWSRGLVRHHGRHIDIDGVEVAPKPVRPIPLWVGAFAERAVARAGRIADGYVASSLPLDEVAWRLRVAEHAAGGREPFQLGVMLDVCFDDEAALSGYRYKQQVYRGWRAGDERLPQLPLPPGDPDDLLIRGDAPAVAAGLRPFAQLGAGRDLTLIVRLHFPGVPLASSLAALRRFAEEVVPVLPTGDGA